MKDTNNIYAKAVMDKIENINEHEKYLEQGLRASLSIINDVALSDEYDGYTAYELMARCGQRFTLKKDNDLWHASKIMIIENPQSHSTNSTKTLCSTKDNPLDAIVGLLKMLKDF